MMHKPKTVPSEREKAVDMGEKEVEIVMHTWRGDLFIVNLKDRVAKKFGETLVRSAGMARMVAVNDVIYVTGGCDQYKSQKHESRATKKGTADPWREVWSLDLLSVAAPAWKRTSSYRSSNNMPYCLSCDGKFFLFGCAILGKDGKLLNLSPGEFYDPKDPRRVWNMLPVPQLDMAESDNTPWGRRISSPPVVDHARNRLLVHFKQIHFLYAYYPEQLKWEPLHSIPSHAWEYDSHPLVFDDMLIFLDPEVPEYFRVFDLLSLKWLSPSLAPVPFAETVCRYFDAFFPLATPGTFCLPSASLVPGATVLKLFTLSVQRTPTQDPLFTFYSVIDVDTTDMGCFYINNYLPIVGRQARLREKALAGGSRSRRRRKALGGSSHSSSGKGFNKGN